jgi:hypothetical protein
MKLAFNFAGLLLLSGTVLAQDLWIRRHDTTGAGAGFEAIVAAGDMNGDGCSDLLQAVTYDRSKPLPPAPFDILHILSGRDHSLLGRLQSNNQDLGNVLPEIGDIDNDGAADFAVGRLTGNVRRLEVYSGKAVKLMFTVSHPAPSFGSGIWSLANAGDVDADNTEDVLLGAPRMTGYGGCLVISGKDGSLIHNVPVPTPPGLVSARTASAPPSPPRAMSTRTGTPTSTSADNGIGLQLRPLRSSRAASSSSPARTPAYSATGMASWRSWFGTKPASWVGSR